MNKYNIKVGDYVETWDGGLGYVTNVHEDGFDWMIVSPRNSSSPTPEGMITPGYVDSAVYKRIGANVFNKKKAEFEPIKKIDLAWNTPTIISNTHIKINELIDHINAIQERLNEVLANE